MSRKLTCLYVFSLFYFLLPLKAVGKTYTIFSGGKSDYVIVVSSSKSSESEKYAANELQACIEKIGGVLLPIVDCGKGVKGKRIILGYNQDYERLFYGDKELSPDDESFKYKNEKGDIVIVGGKERGTMYGVFAFLENELGCRWLSEDCTIIPKRDEYRFSYLSHSESPAFTKRSILYSGITKESTRIHNRINERIITTPYKLPHQVGGIDGFLSPHTMSFLLPLEKYYSIHPEYFAMVEGKRINEKSQPCFTNPDVLNICVEGLRKTIRKYPEISVYEVSALDNENYCHCQKCQDAIKSLGNYSDLVLDFVNRVADSIKMEFPTKKIEYLAYWSTRRPPINVIPRDNVVVRLCNIEICHIHSFDRCLSDASTQFCSDLQRWSDISKDLYIWEYAANFSLYYIPTPNFYALRDNLKSYQEKGIKGVFIEGNHDSSSSEFQALRGYVLSKLLWNPNYDLSVLINDFMNGYYGSSAPYMKQYFDLIHSHIQDDTHLRPFAGYADNYYSNSLFEEAAVIFKKAIMSADNDLILRRIEEEEFSIKLFRSVRMTRDAKKDGTYDSVRKMIETSQMIIGSKNTEKYLKKELHIK